MSGSLAIRIRVITLCFCPLLLFHLFSANASTLPQEQTLTISAAQKIWVHSLAKSLIEEAYKKLHITANFSWYPAQRSLEMANSGQTDGEVARIAGTEDVFTNLCRVPTPLFTFKAVAFSKNKALKIQEWADLKGLRIGIIRGIRYSEINTKDMSPYFAEDVTHLFRLLNSGYISVAIATERAGNLELLNRFSESGITRVGSPLLQMPVYHFLHRKHERLIPQINAILLQMKSNGEIEQILHTEYNKMILHE